MVELKGSLKGIGLAAIVQLIGELHHSGRLELSSDRSSGVLGFDNGRLVSAVHGTAEGMAALMALVVDLADAEFRFIEGVAPGQRTLDLSAAELRRNLLRIADGERVEPGDLLTRMPPLATLEPNVCPLLGFADDPTRHYSRPTALHRCYASSSPSLVTVQEQRELCLDGQYPTCQRFRHASSSLRVMPAPPGPLGEPAPLRRSTLPTAPAAETAQPAGAHPRPPGPSTQAPLVTPQADVPRPPAWTAPQRVAARLAAASRARFGGLNTAVRPAPESSESAEDGPRPESPIRTFILRAGFAALLVAVVAVLPLIIQPGRPSKPPVAANPPTGANRGATASSATEAAAFLREPLATLAAAATATSISEGAIPTAASTPFPLGRSLAQPPTGLTAAAPGGSPPQPPATPPAGARPNAAAVPPSPASRPAAAPPAPGNGVTAPANGAGGPTTASQVQGNGVSGPAGRLTLDVRFASGMPNDWLANAPFAAWSDGAYRLHANQAARFVAVDAPVTDSIRDVVVSATFRKTGGPPGGGYGLIVRAQGSEPRDGVNQIFNGYVFETGDLGDFGVWRRETDHWVDLVPWARSASVRPGGSPNELVVRATGDHLVFRVNSVQVADVTDDTWSSGSVGVFVGGDFNEVALDHFAAQTPN